MAEFHDPHGTRPITGKKPKAEFHTVAGAPVLHQDSASYNRRRQMADDDEAVIWTSASNVLNFKKS